MPCFDSTNSVDITSQEVLNNTMKIIRECVLFLVQFMNQTGSLFKFLVNLFCITTTTKLLHKTILLDL